MNKLLILFKAHSAFSKTDHYNNLYNELIKNHKKYVNKHDDVKSFFLFANPDLQQDEVVTNDSIFFKMDENYNEALLQKVMRGMDFFINKSECTHLFTTNLSTCVNVQKILNICDETPIKSKIGFFDKSALESHFNKKVDYSGTGYYFPSGAGCLFTKEVVSLILNKFNEIVEDKNFTKNYPQADDVLIGKILYELSIQINEIERIDIENPNDLNFFRINKNTSHVRVKYRSNRNEEINAHEKIYDMFSK